MAIGAVEKTTTFYDVSLKGFGLVVRPSGSRSWIAEYRPGAGGRNVSKRRIVIGSAATLTPEQARAEAMTILASVRMGADPAAERATARADISLADLCDRYLEEGCSLKKASTISTDRGRIERHIKPLLGRKRVAEITKPDIERFMRDVAAGKTACDIKTGKRGRSVVTGGKGTATRTVRLLGGMFTWAVAQGYRPDNPTTGVKKFPDGSGERYLNSEELSRLGAAIDLAETSGVPRPVSSSKHAAKQPENQSLTIDPWAAGALRLLVLTGCRLGEILNLTWRDVDMERGLLLLPDSKTGRKTVVLSDAAIAVLASLERVGRYVISGASAGQPDEQPRADLKRPWALVRRHAGLDDVRLHDLRHSFASVGAGQGLGLPVIGNLLGHSQASTTAKYAHLDADPVRRAANIIAGRITAAMQGGKRNG